MFSKTPEGTHAMPALSGEYFYVILFPLEAEPQSQAQSDMM